MVKAKASKQHLPRLWRSIRASPSFDKVCDDDLHTCYIAFEIENKFPKQHDNQNDVCMFSVVAVESSRLSHVLCLAFVVFYCFTSSLVLDIYFPIYHKGMNHTRQRLNGNLLIALESYLIAPRRFF